MNNSTFGKSLFTEIHKLLTIYLTVPMTLATAERSFSTFKESERLYTNNNEPAALESCSDIAHSQAAN